MRPEEVDGARQKERGKKFIKARIYFPRSYFFVYCLGVSSLPILSFSARKRPTDRKTEMRKEKINTGQKA